MTLHRPIRDTLIAALLALSCAGPAAAQGKAGTSTAPALELNRLQAVDAGCRLHVVVSNPEPRRHDTFQLDLVVFDGDGVIARRIALDASPVRPNKTSVYAFDVEGLDCQRIGKLLLNDVIGCTTSDGGADCVAAVAVSSRAGVDFVK